MNKVILMGRLTRDPDIRVSNTADRQITVARYTLAVERRGKKDDNAQTADFISCVAFDRAAEFAEKYLHQGTKVLVTGRIQTGSYTNRDGQKVYTTDIMIEEQEFCESKGQGIVEKPSPNTSVGDGFMNLPDGMDDEGLPFN
nr:MAG TPA: Single strand binding protein [Caudoviricetes sp.]